MDQPPREQTAATPPIPELPKYPVGATGDNYGPSPYGYYEYGYPPYGYPPYGQPVGTNGMAKAAFVLGILGFFGVTAVLGVVFGSLGLGQTRRTGQRGRGFAVAGLTFGAVWIALLGTFAVVAAVLVPDPAIRDARGTIVEAGQVGLFSLRPGDCFTDPNAGQARSVTLNSVTGRPCGTAHNAEIFAVPTATATAGSGSSPVAYPGTTVLDDDAKAACRAALPTYVYDSLAIPKSVRTIFYVPDARAWAAGQRKYVCGLEGPVNLSRSLREDDSVLTADQARYLKAIGDFDRQVQLIDGTDPGADLTTWRRLAGDMAGIAAREDTALTGTWPAGVQPAVDRLVARQARAIPLYELASRADTASDVQEVLGQAMSYVDGDDAITIRKALGLSTSQGQAPNTGAEIL